MANERTSHLTPFLAQPIGRGRNRENREREDFRERSSTFYLDFPTIGPSTPGETRGKVIPTVGAMHGYRYCGVLETPGGRGFLLLVFIPWLRAIIWIGMF